MVCYKIVHAYDSPQTSDVTLIMAEEEKDGCPKCNGKVFEAEKMSTKRGFYHKKCFACIKCRTQVGYFNAIEGPDDEVYCKVDYIRYHGPGGHNKFGEKTEFPCDEESPEACIRCKGQVFEAEKQVAKTGVIHKYCLACNDCHCNLDASSFYNGADGEVYCKHCYAKRFGHKQKSDYKGWMDVKAIQGEENDKLTCPRCNGKVFEAERMVTRIGSFHKSCFSCIECNKKLDSVTVCEGPDNEIYCKSCYSFEFGAKARFRPRAGRMNRARSVPSIFANNTDDVLARATVETWVIKGEKGDGDCCKKCYCVKYGPQSRSSDVDHKLIDLSTIKIEEGQPGKNCPRCGGAVFDNEAVACNKTLLHKKCATCFICEKKLQTNSIYQEKDEFYCDGCYSRKFAPVGYRGAGCATWVDANSADSLRHTYEAY